MSFWSFKKGDKPKNAGPGNQSEDLTNAKTNISPDKTNDSQSQKINASEYKYMLLSNYKSKIIVEDNREQKLENLEVKNGVDIEEKVEESPYCTNEATDDNKELFCKSEHLENITETSKKEINSFETLTFKKAGNMDEDKGKEIISNNAETSFSGNKQVNLEISDINGAKQFFQKLHKSDDQVSSKHFQSSLPSPIVDILPDNNGLQAERIEHEISRLLVKGWSILSGKSRKLCPVCTTILIIYADKCDKDSRKESAISLERREICDVPYCANCSAYVVRSESEAEIVCLSRKSGSIIAYDIGDCKQVAPPVNADQLIRSVGSWGTSAMGDIGDVTFVEEACCPPSKESMMALEECVELDMDQYKSHVEHVSLEIATNMPFPPLKIGSFADQENILSKRKKDGEKTLEYKAQCEIASKILSAKLLKDYKLEEVQCLICGMPLMSYNKRLDCVVCPVLSKMSENSLAEKVKSIQLHERKKYTITKKREEAKRIITEEKAAMQAIRDYEESKLKTIKFLEEVQEERQEATNLAQNEAALESKKLEANANEEKRAQAKIEEEKKLKKEIEIAKVKEETRLKEDLAKTRVEEEARLEDELKSAKIEEKELERLKEESEKIELGRVKKRAEQIEKLKIEEKRQYADNAKKLENERNRADAEKNEIKRLQQEAEKSKVEHAKKIAEQAEKLKLVEEEREKEKKAAEVLDKVNEQTEKLKLFKEDEREKGKKVAEVLDKRNLELLNNLKQRKLELEHQNHEFDQVEDKQDHWIEKLKKEHTELQNKLAEKKKIMSDSLSTHNTDFPILSHQKISNINTNFNLGIEFEEFKKQTRDLRALKSKNVECEIAINSNAGNFPPSMNISEGSHVNFQSFSNTHDRQAIIRNYLCSGWSLTEHFCDSCAIPFMKRSMSHTVECVSCGSIFQNGHCKANSNVHSYQNASSPNSNPNTPGHDTIKGRYNPNYAHCLKEELSVASTIPTSRPTPFEEEISDLIARCMHQGSALVKDKHCICGVPILISPDGQQEYCVNPDCSCKNVSYVASRDQKQAFTGSKFIPIQSTSKRQHHQDVIENKFKSMSHSNHVSVVSDYSNLSSQYHRSNLNHTTIDGLELGTFTAPAILELLVAAKKDLRNTDPRDVQVQMKTIKLIEQLIAALNTRQGRG